MPDQARSGGSVGARNGPVGCAVGGAQASRISSMATALVDSLSSIAAAADAYEAAAAGGDRRTVLEARLRLCAALAQDGWEAPPDVQRQIDFDLFELRQLDAGTVTLPS